VARSHLDLVRNAVNVNASASPMDPSSGLDVGNVAQGGQALNPGRLAVGAGDTTATSPKAVCVRVRN